MFTVGGELPAPIADLMPPTIELGRMSTAALEELVRAEGDIDDRALTQCCALADGNPLIALELARSLTDDERAGRVPLALLPKPPLALARRYAARLDALDPVACRAFAVVAADDTGRAAVVRTALEQLGEPADALDRAEQTGLIEIDGPFVRFTQRLLPAVAYHRVPASSRRAAHRALAEALAAPEDAAARAWQLAAAADGEDETAAEALLLVAGDLTRRGGGASAARVYERAAALSPPGPLRPARVLAAAEAWLDAFDPEAANRVLAGAVTSDDPDLLVGIAAVERWSRGPAAALERVRSGGPARSGDGLARALEADLLFETSGAPAAVDVAAALVDDPNVSDPARRLAELALARAGAAALRDDAPSATSMPRLDALLTLRYALCAADHGRDPDPADHRHVEATVASATASRHRGDVVGAYDRLALEVGLVPERAPLQRAALEVALADVEQLLGRDDDARERLRRASTPSSATTARAGLAANAHGVLGRIALGAGDVTTAARELDEAARSRPHVFGPDLAVLLAATGRPTEAERVLASLAGTADERSVAAPRAERARAAVRADDHLYARATASAERAGFPVEAAETKLAHAEFAARDGRRDDARKLAEQARDDFARCAVRGWDARVARLADGASGSGADAVAPELTAAEHRVALAVADGATNREAAASLFLSVKTVDFHLQNIYRKLGLRSRTELAVRMRSAGGRAGRLTPAPASSGHRP